MPGTLRVEWGPCWEAPAERRRLDGPGIGRGRLKVTLLPAEYVGSALAPSVVSEL